MEDIDEVIRKIDGRIIEEEISLSRVCFKCNISKKVIFVFSIGEFLAIVYFFLTEKNLTVLINRELTVMLIWTLVVIIPFALIVTSRKKCGSVKKLLIRQSALDIWLRTKTPEQQQNMLAIMRTRGLI